MGEYQRQEINLLKDDISRRDTKIKQLQEALRDWDDALTRFSRCQEHEFLAVLQLTKDTEAALRKIAREGR